MTRIFCGVCQLSGWFIFFLFTAIAIAGFSGFATQGFAFVTGFDLVSVEGVTCATHFSVELDDDGFGERHYVDDATFAFLRRRVRFRMGGSPVCLWDDTWSIAA